MADERADEASEGYIQMNYQGIRPVLA